MAAVYGRLGANDLNATTATEVYAVPSSKHATVTINDISKVLKNKSI